MVKLNVNGREQNVDADPSTPLLWALREQLGLTGTKYGCGVAACGSCTSMACPREAVCAQFPQLKPRKRS
jgi:aerobic-type carbon monoxide dehydrogenase small subunit (CoxS/CutS family)